MFDIIRLELILTYMKQANNYQRVILLTVVGFKMHMPVFPNTAWLDKVFVNVITSLEPVSGTLSATIAASNDLKIIVDAGISTYEYRLPYILYIILVVFALIMYVM